MRLKCHGYNNRATSDHTYRAITLTNGKAYNWNANGHRRRHTWHVAILLMTGLTSWRIAVMYVRRVDDLKSWLCITRLEYKHHNNILGRLKVRHYIGLMWKQNNTIHNQYHCKYSIYTTHIHTHTNNTWLKLWSTQIKMATMYTVVAKRCSTNTSCMRHQWRHIGENITWFGRDFWALPILQ